jgi:hypothetical protein
MGLKLALVQGVPMDSIIVPLPSAPGNAKGRTF